MTRVQVERLGGSDVFANAIIALLEADGWVVDLYQAFAGDGICLVAEKPGHEPLRVFADDRAQAAVEALKAAHPAEAA